MATGTSSVTGGDRETSLLVTVVDVSDAFFPSAQPASPAQQVTGALRTAGTHRGVNLATFSDSPVSYIIVATSIRSQLTVSRCLDDVTTFLNSYLLLRQSNSVAVCLCHQGGR